MRGASSVAPTLPKKGLANQTAWLVLAFLLAAAIAFSLIVSPRAGAAVGPCTDVQIIGLRGAGEPQREKEHNMGSLVGPVADEIATQAQGAATVSFYGLPYPAGAADFTTVGLSGSYFRSKKEGSALLDSYLTEEIAACPSTKLVVIGYSQGAHAAGDLLATEPTSITDRIAAFVMFGDPRFNPDASYTWGTFDPRDYGIAGKRSLGDFASWSTRVFSFCNQNDWICQGVGFRHGSAAHAQSVYFGNYAPLVAGLVRRRLGFPRPSGPKTPLDLAFVIDSTGSMGSSIAGVKSAAGNIAQTLRDRGADFRLGLVDYKDTNQGDAYAARVDLGMTSDASAFSNAVNNLSASGGGDTPEAVYSGLMTAINQLRWRAVPRKAIILMGDAPAKNPEPVTGYTQTSVLSAARALDPATVFPVAVGDGPTSSFQPLADGSGGELFKASNPSDVSNQIVAAVDKAAIPLYTSLTVGSPARPGTSVLFSAAGSFYDAGAITSYRWDFNGDGTTDATTATGRTAHVYGVPFKGTASVTVTTEDGKQGSTTADVDIRADAPLPPGLPQNLSAVSGGDPGSLSVSWQSPADLGGGTIVGYQIEVDDAVTGAPAAAIGTDSSTTTVAITELEPGSYNVRVWAASEAGRGTAAERGVQLAGLAPQPPGMMGNPPPSVTDKPRKPTVTTDSSRQPRGPSRIRGLRARAASRRGIKLSFRAAASNGPGSPPARAYLVRQSRRPIRQARDFARAQTLCKGSCRFAITRVGTKLILTITDLRPNTTYYYAVAARDNASRRLGPRSKTVRARTR